MEDTTRGRLIEFLSYKRIGQKKFAEICGLSGGFVNGIRVSIQPDTLAKISAQFPELNTAWLILGQGEMLNGEEGSISANVIHHPKCKESCVDDQMINLYDIDAAANLRTMFDHKGENVLDKLKIPNLGKCDGAIHVKGDSMYPLLKSGDIVIYKEITDLQNGIFFGEMYLVSMELSGDEYLVVKYVNRSDMDGYVKLTSYNKHHDPKDIPLDCIRAMAIVKGSFRYNI